jgi:hypothetical protein
MRASYFTTPPPPRPPPEKHPLFTKKFFSTTSFSPGHIFGAAGLAFGLYALGKAFISAGRAESARVLEASRPQPSGPMTAQAENARGQYGRSTP